MDKNVNIQIAKTILQQLGGTRFKTFTGAKDIVAGTDYLALKLPSNFATDGINYVKITLMSSDTYTLLFQKWNWNTGERKSTIEVSEMYCEDLQRIFTETTGLCTHF